MSFKSEVDDAYRLTEEIDSLLSYRIKELRGSGRGTVSAESERELRRLRTKLRRIRKNLLAAEEFEHVGRPLTDDEQRSGIIG